MRIGGYERLLMSRPDTVTIKTRLHDGKCDALLTAKEQFGGTR